MFNPANNDKKKRICILVQNYFEVAPRARIEARCLVEQGHIVDVIALRSKSNPVKEYDLDGAHVLTIPILKKRASIFRYLLEYFSFFFQAFIKVSYQMFKRRYDVIQVCNLPDFLVFAAIIPKLLGAKVVFDMFEIMPEFFMSKYLVREDHLAIRFLKYLERLCILFSDKVIVINDPVRELLENRGLPREKSIVVMNSADDRLFVPVPSSGDGEKNGRFTMMYHGTLTSLYGLDIAVKAFALVAPEMENAEFWILGDGPERNSLSQLVDQLELTNKVKFIGVVPQQEIPRWLTQCDAGVLATRQDQFLDLSFSSKLPEYILMRKPVIMSRLKTTRFYFSEEALAYFEPNNEKSLASRMVELYQNAETRRSFVENAFREYKCIEWSVMKERYLNLIQSC